MKKMIVICLLAVVSFSGWGQSFDLPRVTNTAGSVTTAFAQFVDMARDMGIVEYQSSWGFDSVSLGRDYMAYLDSVLMHMNRNSAEAYIRLFKANIDRIDTNQISRNQQADMERQLRDVSRGGTGPGQLINKYRVDPFPFSLHEDTEGLAQLNDRAAEYERQIAEYQAQLTVIPTTAQMNNRHMEIRRELGTAAGQRNARTRNALEAELAQIERDMRPNQLERERLEGLISRTRRQIQELGRSSHISWDMQLQQEQFIRSAWESFHNFYEWERFFFRGNNSHP